MGLLQGLFGNLSETSVESLQQEFGMYLMNGETIQTGFKLVRDVMILTDKRIIEFDKQGTTGKKMRVDSINISSIMYVTAETAGFGIDDSELTIMYISTPYLKAHNAGYASKKFEFPKSYNIQSLYKYLQEVAYANYTKLNS